MKDNFPDTEPSFIRDDITSRAYKEFRANKAKENSMIWEAIINGDKNDTIDPVSEIIIVQLSGNKYTFHPSECRQIELRAILEPRETL